MSKKWPILERRHQVTRRALELSLCYVILQSIGAPTCEVTVLFNGCLAALHMFRVFQLRNSWRHPDWSLQRNFSTSCRTRKLPPMLFSQQMWTPGYDVPSTASTPVNWPSINLETCATTAVMVQEASVPNFFGEDRREWSWLSNLRQETKSTEVQNKPVESSA